MSTSTSVASAEIRQPSHSKGLVTIYLGEELLALIEFYQDRELGFSRSEKYRSLLRHGLIRYRALRNRERGSNGGTYQDTLTGGSLDA